MNKLTISTCLVFLLSAPAFADTVVGPNGTPGIATAWNTAGKTTSLTIKDGFSAEEVAEAIERSIPGAKAEADDDTVKVKGVSESDLIKALERIEVDEAMDDIDGAFAAIQNPMGGDDGSGSSIRATKHRSLPGMDKKSPSPSPPPPAAKSYSGQVTSVKHKRFPLVVLSVKTKGGKMLTVIPRIRTKHGIIDYSDKESKQNLAAWYTRRGDKISFKVVKKDKSFSVATDFSRNY
jgi:hypothetical protein